MNTEDARNTIEKMDVHTPQLYARRAGWSKKFPIDLSTDWQRDVSVNWDAPSTGVFGTGEKEDPIRFEDCFESPETSPRDRERICCRKPGVLQQRRSKPMDIWNPDEKRNEEGPCIDFRTHRAWIDAFSDSNGTPRTSSEVWSEDMLDLSAEEDWETFLALESTRVSGSSRFWKKSKCME